MTKKSTKQNGYTWIDKARKEKLMARVNLGEVMKDVAKELEIPYSNAKRIMKKSKRVANPDEP